MNDQKFPPGFAQDFTEAAEAITKGAVANYNVITESQFQREVSTILSRVFVDREALRRYESYVGELTLPLLVAQTDNQQNILFMVPPIVHSPRTSVVSPSSVGLYNELNRRMDRMYDLGAADNARNLQVAFLNQMIEGSVPDYYAEVVRPIQAILQAYDKELLGVTPAETSGGQQSSVDKGFEEESDF